MGIINKLLFLLIFLASCASPQKNKTLKRVSAPIEIQKPAMHMMGPAKNDFFKFPKSHQNQVIWIKGFETRVFVDGQPVPNSKLMCHNTIEKHIQKKDQAQLPFKRSDTWFIGVSSENHLKTKFPSGFAFPVAGSGEYFVNSQVTSETMLKRKKKIQYETQIDYQEESDSNLNFKPLYRKTLMALNPREKGYCHFGVQNLNRVMASGGADCKIQPSMAMHHGYFDSVDEFGQKFSSHWFAGPGKLVHKTYVSKILDLKQDTKIHYISAHVHPGVKSVRLIDKTRNITLFEAKVSAVNGFMETNYFSSTEGIQVFKDNEYELVTDIDNPTSENIDIMAMLYVYMYDPAFRRI